MDYLKSKMVKAESSSSEEEESEDEAVNCDEGSEAEDEDSCAIAAQQDGEGPGSGRQQGIPSRSRKPPEARAEVCGDLGVPGRLGGRGKTSTLALTHVPCTPKTWPQTLALPLAV